MEPFVKRLHKIVVVAIGFLLMPVADLPVAGMGLGGLSSGDANVISPGPMKSPLRISTTGLLVADYRASAIYKVNATNPDQFRTLFTITGKPLSVESAGRFGVLVGDEINGRVETYDRGRRKIFFSYPKSGRIRPLDVAFDKRLKRVFVVDGLAKEVKVYELRGHERDSIGGFGDLTDPRGLVIDQREKLLFVTDYGDPSVGISASLQVFDYDGRHITRITGSFSRPQGVAIDQQKIYVTDALLGKVLSYDRTNYRFAGSYGEYGTSGGQLLLPMDVALVGRSDRLFVVNSRLGKITAFDLSGP